MKPVWMGIGCVFLALAAGCKEDPAPPRVAPPAASAASPVSAGSLRYVLAERGAASFLIDAPLEKIKGRTEKVRGQISLDPKDLGSTRGEVDVDLAELVTETFEDAGKNATQTSHARNWLEIGTDVEAKRREENRFARFTIRGIEHASSNLAAAPEENGERVVTVDALGDLWVHGVSAPKSVKLKIAFRGPTDAPESFRISTVQPLTLSLKEHDVKPRDIAGKFLSGALEKVGKKIDDTVQISLELSARNTKS